MKSYLKYGFFGALLGLVVAMIGLYSAITAPGGFETSVFRFVTYINFSGLFMHHDAESMYLVISIPISLVVYGLFVGLILAHVKNKKGSSFQHI